MQIHWDNYDRHFFQLRKQVTALEAIAAAELTIQGVETLESMLRRYEKYVSFLSIFFGPSAALRQIKDSMDEYTLRLRVFTRMVRKPTDFDPPLEPRHVLSEAHRVYNRLELLGKDMHSYLWNAIRGAHWAPPRLSELPTRGRYEDTWGKAIPHLLYAASWKTIDPAEVRHLDRMAEFIIRVNELCELQADMESCTDPAYNDSDPRSYRHAWRLALLDLTTAIIRKMIYAPVLSIDAINSRPRRQTSMSNSRAPCSIASWTTCGWTPCLSWTSYP